MRAELPWNVAGIPPEAREAARAAARREGLSVGEWLTRRIIAELGEDAVPADTGEQDPDFVPAANRRDTEDMLARLAHAEAEASHTYRRIEEQLRSVGSGLDNAERSQSESNRAMSRAASEITIASHEQAQAFDQLGHHMMGLDDRLEKLERAALQDGLKEAVKGLHQGLSRLADQFGQATSRSGGQVASLARNLEQLALRLVQARADADAATEALDAHLAQIEETQHFTGGTVEQILEKIDAQAESHDENLSEIRRHGAAQQASLAAIEERLTELEQPDLPGAERLLTIEQRLAELEEPDLPGMQRLLTIEQRLAELEKPDLATDQRLFAIEQGLMAVRDELAKPDPHAGLADALNHITLRLEVLEQSHADIVADFHASLTTSLARIPEGAPAEEALAPPQPETPAPIPEPPPMEDASRAEAPEPITDALPDNFVQHAFATHFEMPQDFADALAQPAPANEQDLRRSPQDEAEPQQSIRSLGWTRPAEVEKARWNYLAILVTVFLLFLAAAAALMLNQRFIHANNPPRPIPKHVAGANMSGLTFVPHLQVAPPPQQPPASESAAAPAPAPAIPAAPSAADRVLAAANGGNVTAEAIIGLEHLDSGDAAGALPWLKKAADAGQPVAQYRLGTMYERGQGITASGALAAKWYLAAAGQGNRKAMHNLAVAYAEGSAGRKDTQEAARWFTKAAQLGLSDSEFNLAVLYERGDGVPQSLIDSYKWYSIAAAQGDAESKARLSVLKTQLSASDRDAAERAAQNFQPEPLDRNANIPPEAGDFGG